MNIVKSAWQHLHDHFVPNARNSYQPHLVAHRSLHLYAAFLISLKAATLFSVDLLPQGQAFSSAVNVRNILELTNYSRQSYGLDQLQESSLLDTAAQAKADDMAKQQYFAHVSPAGRTPWDFISAAGYNYMIAGENLAINFYSAEGVAQAWMNSPEHKANILNKDFKDIGIGISEGQYQGVKAIWVVQMFGTSTDRPFTPRNGFTLPQPQAQAPKISLPAAAGISLQKPVINDPGFYLTDKEQLSISGRAAGASTVYVLINHQPRVELPASDGIFSGNIALDQGDNALTVVAFNSAAQASPVSDPIRLKLDSVAPKIISSAIVPQSSGGQVAYILKVQMQGDPVKIVARAGQNSFMLKQQDSGSLLWTAAIPADVAQSRTQLTVSAYDLAGNVAATAVASFAESTQNNYGFLGTHQERVSLFGKSFDLGAVNNVYVYFVIGLLGLLILTIAVRRNVRHIGMIAHTSAMIALAIIFWVR